MLPQRAFWVFFLFDVNPDVLPLFKFIHFHFFKRQVTFELFFLMLEPKNVMKALSLSESRFIRLEMHKFLNRKHIKDLE